MTDTREDPFDTGILPQAADSPVLVVLNPDHGGDHDLNQAASLVRQLTGRDPAAYTDEAGITVVYASPAPAYPPPPEFTPDQNVRATQLERVIELLNRYGQAMNGDQWWPGNASAWLSGPDGAELEALLNDHDTGQEAAS